MLSYILPITPQFNARRHAHNKLKTFGGKFAVEIMAALCVVLALPQQSIYV